MIPAITHAALVRSMRQPIRTGALVDYRIKDNGMKLTDAQNEKLGWLHKQGGSGYLDKHGRVVAGGDYMPQGCWPAWLNLVAHGLIAGGDGRLTITDYGRRHIASSGASE